MNVGSSKITQILYNALQARFVIYCMINIYLTSIYDFKDCLDIILFGVIISLPVALLTDWNSIRLKLGLLFCLLYTHKTSLKFSSHFNNFSSVITGIVLIVWTVYSLEYRLHRLVLVAQKQYILVAFLTRIFSHVFCFFNSYLISIFHITAV